MCCWETRNLLLERRNCCNELLTQCLVDMPCQVVCTVVTASILHTCLLTRLESRCTQTCSEKVWRIGFRRSQLSRRKHVEWVLVARSEATWLPLVALLQVQDEIQHSSTRQSKHAHAPSYIIPHKHARARPWYPLVTGLWQRVYC